MSEKFSTELKKKRRKQLFKGEGWYVRLPGAEALSKFQIMDVCGSVVTVREYEGYTDTRHHYEIDKLEWVERFKMYTL